MLLCFFLACKSRPEQAEKGCRPQSVFQRLPYPVSLPRPKVGGYDGLRSLPHTVGAALHKGADIYNDSVHRQGVRAKVDHDLTIEKDGQYAHGHIDKEGGKSGHCDFF